MIIFLMSLFVSAADPTLVVALGDSLTEGYGVARAEAYPALLENRFKGRVRIQNAGISGSTSASAVSRMKWILKSKPKIVILALGENDGLRGLDVREMEKNLDDAIDLAVHEHVKVLFCGALLPTNYGSDYRKKFEDVFRKIGRRSDITYVPFLLEGVAMKKELNQADGIHPNANGHKVIADHLEPVLEKML